MYFLVDTNKQVIFGWSAKCGCSHVKTIFLFLQTGILIDKIHINDRHRLPNDIENYTTIIFTRNPYNRLVSGFLDKYGPGRSYRNLWKHPSLTFSRFVDEVIKSNWTMIDKHHFTSQITEDFDKKILKSKMITCYDVTNIDYTYIEQLYNTKIPENIINKKRGHERTFQNQPLWNNTDVYDLHIDKYINYDIDLKYFYNHELRTKVFLFYKDDFYFFDKYNIDYINPCFRRLKK